MKQIKLTLLLFLLTTGLLKGQELQQVETPLTWMILSITDDMHLAMEIENSTFMAVTLQQSNPEAEKLMFTSFDLIRGMIMDSTGVDIPPANTLEGKIKYSKLGLPLATLKKAAKSSDFQQFVKIDITVSPFRPSTTETSIGDAGATNANMRARPEVRVVAKFAGEDGKTIESYRGTYIHEEEIEISSQSLSVMGWQVTVDQNADAIPYYFYLQKAVEDLIRKMKGE